MFNFNSDSVEGIQNEMNEKKIEFANFICEVICDAVEEGLESVTLGYIIMFGGEIFLEKESYLKALEKNLETVEQCENYELCSRIVKTIDILKSN